MRYVKFTRPGNFTDAYVNPLTVTHVVEWNNKTTMIHFDHERHVVVNESLEEVGELLSAALGGKT